MGADADSIVAGAIQALMGLTVSTGFLLALFIGFLVFAGFTKLRKAGRRSLVVRNLVDRMGDTRFQYLSPDAPSGGADQLKTPELMEQSRKPSS